MTGAFRYWYFDRNRYIIHYLLNTLHPRLLLNTPLYNRLDLHTHTYILIEGFARTLLNDSIDIMTRESMECSLLHAGSESLRNMYASIGSYESVLSRWSLVRLDMSRLLSISFSSSWSEKKDGDSYNAGDDDRRGRPVKVSTRLAIFPNDTRELMRIHSRYSEERFAGCIVRDERYWNEYLSREIPDLLVLTTTIDTIKVDCGDDNNNNNDGKEKSNNKEGNNYRNRNEVIVGFLSIRHRNGRYQLREFGFNLDLDNHLAASLDTSSTLSQLLHAALSRAGYDSIDNVCINNKNNNEDETDGVVELHLPTAVLEDIMIPSPSVLSSGRQNTPLSFSPPWIDASVKIKQENDLGWMYRTLTTTSFADTEDNNIDNVVVTKATDIFDIVRHHGRDHLIWPSDSF